MASPISPLTNNNPAANASQTTPAPDASTKLVGEDVFLKLLVAQLKNQDPTSPADPMAFVTQLAQFSQLETLYGIRGDLQASIAANPQPTLNTPSSSQSSGTNPVGSTPQG
jgi:flagellar basal-body rod modification protein FlgD